MKTVPELLMPAGSLQKLEYAFAFGADAVYVGVPFFSLRARENEFDLESLKKARELADRQGKKIYVTANVFARNRKIAAFHKHLEEWALLRPDALIMSDPGLIQIVREKHPEIPIHLSVQANCMNWQGVKFWHEVVGVERVILSRELNLNEIREIKQRVPDVELEAFVHGSICIAYSGRCLMSSYFSHRDANQGVCDNSCREKFHVFAAKPEDANVDYYIEDLRNRGEFYQIDEDENGTFIMNAKDLRLIEYLKDVADAGVCSFKVEGRTKSVYYLALVTRAYRQALDDLAAGKDFDPSLLTELDKVANRGYHTGFMIQQPGAQAQNYGSASTRNYKQRFAGLVLSDEMAAPAGCVAVEVRGRIERGQECEVIGPFGSSRSFIVGNILNSKGAPVDVAHGGTGLHYFEIGFDATPYGILSVKEV